MADQKHKAALVKVLHKCIITTKKLIKEESEEVANVFPSHKKPTAHKTK